MPGGGGLSGLHRVPVTKFILFTVGSVSCLASLWQMKHMLWLQLFPSFSRQWWKLVTHQLAFTSSSETLFGLLLIYHLRFTERIYGHRKFASFLATSTLCSTVFQSALLLALPRRIHALPSGPYGIIFALLYIYIRDFPVQYQIRLGGVGLTDKMFIYVLGIQLILSSWPLGIVNGLTGLAAGALFRENILGLGRWRFPVSMSKMATAWVLPWLDSGRAPQRINSMVAEMSGTDGGNITTEQPPSAELAVSEENIALIMSMGFSDRAVVEQALRQNGNNVERAVNSLLI